MAARMPKGSKIWLLNLGLLDVGDDAVVKGANKQLPGRPMQPHSRRSLVMVSALVYHPRVGLFLFDCGSAEDIIKHWTPEYIECTPRIWDRDVNGLPAAIKATGNDIKDVKAVIISHLHLDHAGGLEHFMNTDTEIWVHEVEYKDAFWQAGTGMDVQLYRSQYLTVEGLKWRTFNSDTFEIFRGVTLHRCPGHTSGLCIAQFSLSGDESFIMTSDLFHVAENWEQGMPQGLLLTDFNAWHRSRTYVRNLAERLDAKVLLGHDVDYFNNFSHAPQAAFGSDRV